MKRAHASAFCLVVAVCLAAVTSCGRPRAGEQITIKGSDTMVHLVSTWAEAFLTDHPEVGVSVTGGGSGTGIAALLNGTTDLCAASRELTDSERALAAQKKLQLVEQVVARDGIAVVVHPDNPVKELSLEQLRKIYTGAYERWSQVGGPDEPIIVLSRESSSGTYVFFQEHVLAKKDFRQDARLMTATSAIIQSVADEKWDIGYVGLGYAIEAGGKVKTLGIRKDASAPAVMPSEKTVDSGEYAIARLLYLYTAGEPAGRVKEFLDFCLGPTGQQIVRQTGYVPVKTKHGG